MLKKGEIREAIAQLGRIVKGAPLETRAYAVEDGEIRAASTTMMGGVPLDYDGQFAVGSDGFERAVNALSGDIEVETGMRTLQLISGKTRVSLPKFDADLVRKRQRVEGVTVDLDPEFARLARDVSSVVSEQRVLDWQSSLIVRGGDIVGMDKGNLLVAAHYEPFKDVEHALLPLDLVDMVTMRKTPPREVVINPNQVSVEFQDDAWVVGQLIAGNVPHKVFDLLGSSAPHEMQEITDAQRSALDQIEKLGADTVEIEAGRMTAQHEHGDIVIEVDSPVGKPTRWGVKHLARAVRLATHWSLDEYPLRGRLRSERLRILCAAKAV